MPTECWILWNTGQRGFPQKTKFTFKVYLYIRESGKGNMAVTLMTDLDLSGRRVLIREDLNVPIVDGKILESYFLHSGARVVDGLWYEPTVGG